MVTTDWITRSHQFVRTIAWSGLGNHFEQLPDKTNTRLGRTFFTIPEVLLTLVLLYVPRYVFMCMNRRMRVLCNTALKCFPTNHCFDYKVNSHIRTPLAPVLLPTQRVRIGVDAALYSANFYSCMFFNYIFMITFSYATRITPLMLGNLATGLVG